MQSMEVTRKVEIKDLFRIKNYTLLLFANLISRFGDSVDSIAYGWMVYILTGSKLLLGTLFAVNALPNILLGPFAGVMADRFSKKKLIFVGFFGRGIAVSLTALLYSLGLLEPWHLFAFTIFNSTLETLTMPAAMSLLPIILKKEEFLSANSFSSSAYKLAELFGTATAGLIIATLGISGAILLDGITFFAAAFIMLLISVQHIPIQVKDIGVKGYLLDIRHAFNFVKSQHLIRKTLLLFALVNFCLAPINVLMPVFANDVLGGGPNAISFMGVSLLVGMIIGGVALGQFGSRFKISRLIIIGLLFFGAAYSMLALPGYVIPLGIFANITTYASFFVMGLLIPVIASPMQVYIMQNTEKSMMGRVGAFLSMISCAAIPIGASLTGIVSEVLAPSIIFLAMGGIIVLIAAMQFFSRDFLKV